MCAFGGCPQRGEQPSPSDDLDRPARMREQGVGVGTVQVDDLDLAGLGPAMPGPAAAGGGSLRPRQTHQRLLQQRLVARHGEQVVAPRSARRSARARWQCNASAMISTPLRSGRVARATLTAASPSPAATSAWVSTNWWAWS